MALWVSHHGCRGRKKTFRAWWRHLSYRQEASFAPARPGGEGGGSSIVTKKQSEHRQLINTMMTKNRLPSPRRDEVNRSRIGVSVAEDAHDVHLPRCRGGNRQLHNVVALRQQSDHHTHKKLRESHVRAIYSGGGSGGRGQGVLDLMHGPSRMTIDLRIPTMPGRSTSSFHRPGRHCLLAPSFAKHREVVDESHGG